ncbi:MAG: DUF3618 domain-containing protein [Rhodoglobus sp.]
MSELQSRVEASRAELEATLNAIEDKLNVPRRVGRVAWNLRRSYEMRPAPWILGGIAAAVVAAAIVSWAILSNDD